MPVPSDILKDPDYHAITMFPNQGRGALWGVTRLGRQGLPEGIDISYNMMVGASGRVLTASLAPTDRFALASISPPVEVMPWEDSSDTPTAIILYWNKSKLFKNAAITDETVAFNGIIANATFFQSESATPAARLFASTRTGDKELNNRTQAGVWAETASTPALLCIAVGKDFYKALNEYQIEKYTGSGTVTTDANYGGNYNVGAIDSEFRSVGAILEKTVWAKTDGKLYAYDRDSDTFVPIYETNPHPLHFPFMTPWRGGLLTALFDGALVYIPRSGQVKEFRPLKDRPMSRDTPQGRWVDAVQFQDDLILYMDSGWRLCTLPGLVMYKTDDNGSTYTDYSTEVQDGRDDTFADLSSLDTTDNLDWVVIGADVPWAMTEFRMILPNGTATRLRVCADFQTGAENVPSFDGTNTVPNGTAVPLGQSGRIVLDSEYNKFAGGSGAWDPAAISINGTDVTKYWQTYFLEAI